MLTKDEKKDFKELLLRVGTLIPRCGFVISYPDVLDIINYFTIDTIEENTKGEDKNGDN